MRCNAPFSCKVCGGNYQRGKFKQFITVFEHNPKDIITYFVIKSSSICSLREGLSNIFLFLEDIKKLKKRNNISDFYSRIEVSFKNSSLGFNPHINMLFFQDVLLIEEIAEKYNLTVWKRKKENKKDVILSLIWYFLKFNNIGIEKGEAVRIALNKKRQIIHSSRFNTKNISYIDELIDIDFSFLGVYPIRSKEEILLREEVKKERAKLNKKLKTFICNDFSLSSL
jgi:hypothetical protein